MSVRIQGERQIDAPREHVYATLTDPAVVAATIPLVERYEQRDADHWTVVVKIPLPLSPTVPIEFEVVEKRPPEYARLRAAGGKFGGSVDVVSRFELSESGSGTLVRFQAELSFHGTLAPVEKMLEPVAQRQAEKTLDAIEQRSSAP